jgi:hypothetical protein
MDGGPEKPHSLAKALAIRIVESRIQAALFLLFLNFVVHYSHFRDLGLNGEDYSHPFMSLDKDPWFVLALAKDSASKLLHGSLGLEGRLLGHFLDQALASMGWMLGKVPGLQIVSLLITTACSCVMYRIFAQRGEFLLGFLAALFLSLYPAYALRQYINAQFWLMPSLLFMLLAVKSLVAGRRVAPYAFIACSLVTYESPVFPFMAAPLLLDVKWDGRFFKKFAVHLLILAVMIAVIFWLRSAEREGRVMELGEYLSGVPGRVAIFISYGTFISVVYSAYHAAIYLFRHRGAETLATAAIFAPAFAYILYAARTNSTGSNAAYVKTAFAGVIFIMLAYAVGFFPYYRITMLAPKATLAGVVSRVHMAASFGTAIFFSSSCLLLMNAVGARTRLLAACLIALLLAAFAGYSHAVQDYYRDGWRYQRCLWSKIIEQAPDVSEGTVIFVDQRGLPLAEDHPAGFSWYTLLRSFPYIYEFPRQWDVKPTVALRYREWKEKPGVRQGTAGVEINLAPWHSEPRWVSVEQGNLIYFKAYRGDISRFDGVLDLDGHKIRLKPKPHGRFAAPFPKGFFYDSVYMAGCSFAALSGIAPPRDIEGAPRLSKTLAFDGTNHLIASLDSKPNLRSFTIELWLRPGENEFGPMDVMNEKYPPMPAIIGPLRLDHASDDVLHIGVAGLGAGPIYEARDMFGAGKRKDWLHVALDVDNARRSAALFINGKLEYSSRDADVKLAGDISLGKGHFNRFWKGEMADLRISSVVRHTTDFEPEKAQVSRDEHTLYFIGE